MKIAIITTQSGLSWAASEELWYRAALYALACKHSIVIGAFDWGGLPSKMEYLQKQGAKIYKREPLDKKLKRTLFKKAAYKMLNKLCKFEINKDFGFIIGEKPDVILINQGHIVEIAYNPELWSILKQFPKKVSILSHSSAEHMILPEHIRNNLKEVISSIQCIFFVSERNKQNVMHQLAMRFSNSGIAVNPVNLDNHDPIEYPDIEKTIQFASVGRLDSTYKGQDLLFRIFHLDKWKDRNFHLNLYGEGEDKSYLMDLIHFYKLENKVTFHGHVDNIRDVWKINHLLLMPSFGEGMPLTLVEAMICCRPAIASDVGGNSELVVNYKTGFLAEAPTINLFDAALELAWTNKGTWKEMGSNASKLVKTKIVNEPGEVFFKQLVQSTS